ncbi:ribonuclease J [Candidatus Xianfuyuplasma coldseepsis]|uniref:Ribonuclease J n=1 Tax=Candidatus Xianfuyuplasma coldseepsis TaxID=2782163 RepID=A0A7L7KUY8_9MOLU|nr:ribonuclease J [Xianfuyuplasma coldseepsis]QMS85814.1 ribonuclease J [Xianfuyuplasma coldseepsis]
MARIKLFALGGLGENGKNMYCVDIDGHLFVLDAGLKYPSNDLYGVDSIIPDTQFLEDNKDRIVGLFLSHGHEDHIGAVPKLLKTLPLPIYASYFTLAVLKDSLEDQGLDTSAYTFHEVTAKKTLQFGPVQVDFFGVTHSIPESMGIAIHTKDGSIVYAPDYMFDQNVQSCYKTDFAKLSKIAGREILALLTESLGSERSGYTHGSANLDYVLNQAFNQAEGRIITTAFSTDLVRIQKVIDIALKHNRDIAIIGRKTQRTVDIAVNLGYLKIPEEKLLNLRFIDDQNKNELHNAVVLVTGDRHEPFYMVQRMVKKLDKLIHINEADTMLLMTPPVPGTERIAARTMDILYRNECNVIKVSKHILPPNHASSEDVKLLINILNPRYIVPVIGEYRHQYALKDIVLSLGYHNHDILMLDNGQVAEINNRKVVNITGKVHNGDILVDGILDSDVSDVVLRDREMLAQDGVVLIIANIDPKQKKVVSTPEVVSRGFVFMKENEELIQGITDKFYLVSANELNGKYVNWRTFKNALREQLGRYLYKETRRKPIIIPVLIDTQV